MINFPDNPTNGQQFVVGTETWTWDGVKWTAYPGALSIPDAPQDGQAYGRKFVTGTMQWAIVSTNSGITDAPTGGGIFYGRRSAGWVQPIHTDITDWVPTLAPYALTANVPVVTTITPKINGTAAIGTDTGWAKGDHVHPTDTSLYSASNPAGYQTAAQVTASLGPYATTAALAAYLPLAGGQLTGNLSIASASPAITLRKSASGGDNTIYGYTGANPRWGLDLGNSVAESGSNAGSGFTLSRYSDAGAYIDTPFQINRGTGVINVAPAATSTNTTQSFIVGNRALTVGSGDGLSYGLNGIVCEFSLTAGNVITVNRRTGNGSAISFYQQNTSCGSITLANSTTTAYNTTSDVRLKADEKSFDAGPILDKLKVYNFRWKNNRTRAYGVMAQECNEVFPDAVTYIAHNDHWGVDYSKFVPLLLQEIKDLRARVAQLEEKL